MQIKQGVVISGLNIKMRPVLIAADKLWKKNGQELVITGGLEGTHSAGSFHYYGLAVDLRTRDFSKATTGKITEELRNDLGADYDVVVESSHMHVEYDPK